MARASTAMVGTRTPGVGNVSDYVPFWPSPRESDPCAPSPAWCDWFPGSDYITECHPIDPSKCQARTFGPALTPASRTAAIQAGNQATDAYLRQNPQDAAAYYNWLDNKSLYELNPAAVAQKASDTLTSAVLLGAALLGAVILVKGR